MIVKLCSFLLRSTYLRGYVRRVHERLRDAIATSAFMETSVPEATPVACRTSIHPGLRFNLVIPALSIRHVFGGIATAIDIFQFISANTPNVRILLSDESTFEHSDNPAFSEWKIAQLEDADSEGRWIVPMGNRYGKTLPVAPEDRFVASAWWTAGIVRNIREWQASTYDLPSVHRFLYLIQDYEPGFYPWSSRYALAEATYRENDGLVALFNTSILQRFFADQGYQFHHQFAFEPSINQQLAAYIDQVDPSAKEKKILVYGRPGVPRNAFELVVMGLREWTETCHDAASWTIISVGETHNDIALGNGVLMHSKGKLSLKEYAHELTQCSIGVSLMISPHPSYPPLEMAAFGLKVLTNGYGAKNLSEVHENIVSLITLSPRSIADALNKMTSAYGAAANVGARTDEFWGKYANHTSGRYEALAEIVDILST